ncbi:hypothetical protein D7X74_05215 [Corallococcus sp. CA047B]|uniref:hypothetical protein n=1 Tax=Corallococcus sp. CA047B TaxID=2316729 RepID=UPI000EA2D5D4|nr:hypothetical protein [Corallococcus sp. CA047B]RKH19986.1 hypothetical protein D7X74_05215 [Corallococcus sp. CA047B]
MKRLLLMTTLALAAGCYTKQSEEPTGLTSFRVEVTTVTTGDSSAALLPVVNSCAARYGNDQAAVPISVRGTPECLYSLPRGDIDIGLTITALDGNGGELTSFNGPVSFRVVPGDITGDYSKRWAQLTNGKGTGSVRVAHLYGETHVWVQDEPFDLDYSDGGVVGDLTQVPQEPATRTFSTGLSNAIRFEEPSIASLQTPQGGLETSVFLKQFLRIGRNPEAGEPLVQNCDPSDPNNGQQMKLLVTGTDSSGFYVTDMTACRVPEKNVTGANIQTPEPDGFNPGRFNSLYVYNYQFPEGLDSGDLIWTLSGTVAEFTSTTQVSFPAWTLRENVRLLPQSEWNKYLDQVPPVEINGRLCGFSSSNYLDDLLCGYSYRNFKMESLESSLVKLRRVKFPRVFKNCDANGNNDMPMFCPVGSGAGRSWTNCFEEPPDDPDVPERKCVIDCTLGIGDFAGTICAERTTYTNFGQFVVEMNATGPASANLDASVPGRITKLTAGTTSVNSNKLLSPGARLNLVCDQPVRVRFGPDGVTAAAGDMLLAANVPLEYTLKGNETTVAVVRDATATANGTCQFAPDSRTRISLQLKDAVPDLNPDCSETDADAAKALQCKQMRAATFDVVGHLKHVGPARPRWNVLPRDQDDLCCYPGPGLECPKPIKPCP